MSKTRDVATDDDGDNNALNTMCPPAQKKCPPKYFAITTANLHQSKENVCIHKEMYISNKTQSVSLQQTVPTVSETLKSRP